MKWPRLIIGLLIVFISVAGLLAVSSLVPDVGCEKQPKDFLKTATRLLTTVPGTAAAGQSFTINGTLEKATRPFNPQKPEPVILEPFPQQRVTVFAQMQQFSAFTDENGHFKIELTLKILGVCSIDTVYPGDAMDYYFSSGDRKQIEITGVAPVVGESNYWWLLYILLGLLLLLTGYQLLMKFILRRQADDDTRGAKKSVRRKRRTAKWLLYILAVLVFVAFLFALYPRQGYLVHEGEPDPDRLVTKMHIDVPARSEPGQSFTVNGKLSVIENRVESPLPQQPVTIYMIEANNSIAILHELAAFITDSQGSFSGNVTIDNRGRYEVSAIFDQTGNLYIESSDMRNINVGGGSEIWGNWNSPGWLSIMIGIPLTILLLIGSFLIWRRYRAKRRAHEPPVKSTPISLAPPTETGPSSHDNPWLRIEFPQIPPPFPDVWGRGDTMEIVIGKIADSEQTTLKLELEPGVSQEFTFDDDGTVTREHIYGVTGRYDIKAVLAGETRNAYLPASRNLRIVDYREEIVRLYNDLVVDIRSTGLNLPPRLTAREMQSCLLASFPVLNDRGTDLLITTFEKADYSLHLISRPDYETMYLAVQEVLKQIKSR